VGKSQVHGVIQICGRLNMITRAPKVADRQHREPDIPSLSEFQRDRFRMPGFTMHMLSFHLLL
jgi:hypothetical protein